MNHWSFILAAYALTVAATAGLGLASFLEMRRFEREAERLRQDR